MNKSDDVYKKLESYLEQCTHFDKDQRYMAVSDMSNILSQGVRLDPQLEKRVGDCLVKLFDDKSIDVQSIAVKTVSVLVGGKMSQEKTIVDVFTLLCKKMLSDEDMGIRNLYAIGLKTCISSLESGSEQVDVVCSKIVPLMIQFVNADRNTVQVQDSLEVLNDLISKTKQTQQSAGMEKFHEQLIQMSITQLGKNSNTLVRKRAISMLGFLSIVSSDALLRQMVENVMRIGGIESVLAIGAIGREAGNRLGAYVDTVVPLLQASLQDPSQMQTATGDDHREFIFQALESFILRCPGEMDKHLAELLSTKCFVFLHYDPNFNDDAGMEDVEEDAVEDEENNGEYSDAGEDDDDSSWKVRRAVAKLLSSLISSRPETIKAYFSQLESHLQVRFAKERIESVRLDVLEAYKDLLDATVVVEESSLDGPVPLTRQRSNVGQVLRDKFTKLSESLIKLLRQTRQPKSKIAVVQVIAKLLFVMNGAGFDKAVVDKLVPQILALLKDRNANLRLESLLLCRNLVVFDTGLQESHLLTLRPQLLRCVEAEWFKIVSEALRVIAAMCARLEALRCTGAEWGQVLIQGILPRLRQADIDQEIKNCAIEAAGSILAVWFSALAGSEGQKQTLTLLLERLRNESSRLAALRAFDRVASRPAAANSEFTKQICPLLATEFAALLRQQSREVRQHTLQGLISMVDVALFVPAMAQLDALVNESSAIVAEGKDSHLVHLVLAFYSLAMTKLGAQGRLAVRKEALEKILAVTSGGVGGGALLAGQGQAGETLMIFYQTAAQLGDRESGLAFEEIYPALMRAQEDEVYWTRVQTSNKALLVATACAVLIVAVPNAETRKRAIGDLLASIASAKPSPKKTSTSRRLVQLQLVGEIGKRISLAGLNVDGLLQATFTAAEEDEEQIKTSAAASLGKLVVGDAASFLPIVIKSLTSAGANKYLLLVSLKELLSAPGLEFKPEESETIAQVLRANLAAPEEEVRHMIGECLGKLAGVAPKVVLSQIVPDSSTESPLAIWTKITAMRYAVVSCSAAELVHVFPRAVLPFLATAGLDGSTRDSVEICKAALSACHALIHHAPEVVLEVFPPEVVENIFSATRVIPALQKKVDFGPFKILVDDGLPLRKSAYACLASLFENLALAKLLGALNTGKLLPSLAQGLNDAPEDAPDIPLTCHQLLGALCVRAPLAVMAHCQTLCKSLQECFTKIKIAAPAAATKEAVDEDPEKKERKLTILRAALRTLHALAALPGAMDDRNVGETIAVVHKAEHLHKIVVDEGMKSLVRTKQ